MRNLDFCCCCADAGRGITPGAAPGVIGVDVPELGAVSAPELLTASVDPSPVPDEEGRVELLMAVVVTESTEFDRCALDRRGNMLGILNPGELGFGASGVFCTAAGVGVIGVSAAGGADGGRG